MKPRKQMPDARRVNPFYVPLKADLVLGGGKKPIDPLEAMIECGMGTTRILELRNGRQIALDEDGDPAGIPVFFFHGWPASRLQGGGFGPEARELGMRILSPDRPGIGLSTFQEQRQLLDWPPVLEELAGLLGIERLRILAISGGGPYALASAFALPGLVEAVSVVSGAPPLGPEIDPKTLLVLYRWLLAIYRWRPELLRSLFALALPLVAIRPPRWLWPALLRFVPKEDRHALRESSVFEGSLDCYLEAWRGSARGVMADGEIYAHDWGFALESIQSPVRLWHGKSDRSFSWQLAEAVSKRLINCKTFFIESEGHYSLPIQYKRPILEDLLRLPGAESLPTVPTLGARPD